MSAAVVVEGFDVPDDSHAGVFLGYGSFAAEGFFLEAGAKRFGHGVVPGVTDRGHAERDVGVLGVGAVAQAGVLAAVVGVGDHAGGFGTTRGAGHAQRVQQWTTTRNTLAH